MVVGSWRGRAGGGGAALGNMRVVKREKAWREGLRRAVYCRMTSLNNFAVVLWLLSG